MSNHLNGSRSMYDIEDVSDDAFLNHPRHGSSGYVLGQDSGTSWENKRQQLLEERRKIEEKTLLSTKASLGLIYETEKTGLQTAEELLHQREQLENVNEKLDSINAVMRVSQKHITSMKSIFGGVKNYFSKGGSSKSLSTKSDSNSKLSSSASENSLGKTLDSIKSSANDVQQRTNPALKRIDENYSYDDGDKSGSAYDQHSRQVDKQLDENLSEIGMGIGRLKELALGLGSEIDSQSTLIETITSKSDRSQDTISNQNRQMNKILKS